MEEERSIGVDKLLAFVFQVTREDRANFLQGSFDSSFGLVALDDMFDVTNNIFAERTFHTFDGWSGDYRQWRLRVLPSTREISNLLGVMDTVPLLQSFRASHTCSGVAYFTKS